MINLYDILDAADGQLFGEPAAQLFTGFSFDPRGINGGELFVALKTERGDGHHYMEEAVAAGAQGLMCHHPPNFDTTGVTVMIMRDVEGALMRWSEYILKKHAVTVIAVTGSHGKNSAVHAIAQSLATRYEVLSSHIDIPGRFGIPLALSQLTAKHQMAVLSFTSAHSGDMREMLRATTPSVGVVTQLTDADDVMPSLQLNEARTLMASLPEDGLAVLNYDQPAVRGLAAHLNAPSITVSVDAEGRSFGADLTAYNLVVAIDKTGFDLRYGSERYVGKWTPLLGAHQLYSVLCAVSVGLSFDVSLDDTLQALTNMTPLPGEMRPLQGTNGALLIDASANADSHTIRAAMKWLQAIRPESSIRETQHGQVSPHGKIYVVVGEYANNGHSISPRDLTEDIVDVASVLVTEGESAAEVARHANALGFPLPMLHMTFSPQDSALAIRDQLSPKDVVLITGGAVSRMERVAAELLENPTDHQKLPRYDTYGVNTTSSQPLHHTWLEVDVDAIAHNTQRMKSLIGDGCHLMAVVKGDAYGHGLTTVGTTALHNGASMLGVANTREALALRAAGVSESILVLGYTPSHLVVQAIKNNITLSLFDQNIAREMNRIASGFSQTVTVHIRVDMSGDTMGIASEDLTLFFRSMSRLEWINIQGIYTELGMPYESQLKTFKESVAMLKAAGIKFEMVHAAASGLALEHPETRLDMVRSGRALVGLNAGTLLPDDFQTALTWKTSVVQVKRLLGKMTVDDNGIPITTRPRIVGIIPVGYMDGLRWGAKSWQSALIKGQETQIVGQVDAYQSMIDITKIDDVRTGDEVVLLGKQGDAELRAEKISADLGTRPADWLPHLAAHLPRIR